jgi:hypothetical protein
MGHHLAFTKSAQEPGCCRDVGAADGVEAGEVADLGAQRHEGRCPPYEPLGRMVNKMQVQVRNGHISS